MARQSQRGVDGIRRFHGAESPLSLASPTSWVVPAPSRYIPRSERREKREVIDPSLPPSNRGGRCSVQPCEPNSTCIPPCINGTWPPHFLARIYGRSRATSEWRSFCRLGHESRQRDPDLTLASVGHMTPNKVSMLCRFHESTAARRDRETRLRPGRLSSRLRDV